MKIYRCLLIALAVLTLNSKAEEKIAEFESVVIPFLENYCMDCHDADVSKGDVVLDDLVGVDKHNFSLWYRVWEHVALKQMPPPKKKSAAQPDPGERYEFTQWLTQTFQKVMEPHGGYHTHRKASKGNHLDHDLLFGKISGDLTPTSSPARLWRIHPNEHLGRINDLINQPRIEGYQTIFDRLNRWSETYYVKLKERHGKHIQGIDGDNKAFINLDRIVDSVGTIKPTALKGYKSPLMIDHGHGFEDYAHYYSVNQVELNQIIMIAKEIVQGTSTNPCFQT